MYLALWHLPQSRPAYWSYMHSLCGSLYLLMCTPRRVLIAIWSRNWDWQSWLCMKHDGHIYWCCTVITDAHFVRSLSHPFQTFNSLWIWFQSMNAIATMAMLQLHVSMSKYHINHYKHLSNLCTLVFFKINHNTNYVYCYW